MENKGRVSSSSSSSSSFTTQLFGPKEPSSSTMFNSIFTPTSKGFSRNNPSPKHESSLDRNKESTSNNNNKVVEPCHLSSSLYYGGQDVYSQSTNNQTCTRRREADDVNSQDASRGNWWQGSLYY